MDNSESEASVLQYIQDANGRIVYVGELFQRFATTPIPTIVHSLRDLLTKNKIKNLYTIEEGNRFISIG